MKGGAGSRAEETDGGEKKEKKGRKKVFFSFLPLRVFQLFQGRRSLDGKDADFTSKVEH